MGDLPRWIDDPTVDSPSMLSAYLFVRSSTQDAGRVIGPLTIVVHLPALAFTPSGTVSVLCADADCQRCRSGRGGYAFRWYHHSWHETYLEGARPGAWQGPARNLRGPY